METARISVNSKVFEFACLVRVGDDPLFGSPLNLYTSSSARVTVCVCCSQGNQNLAILTQVVTARATLARLIQVATVRQIWA